MHQHFFAFREQQASVRTSFSEERAAKAAAAYPQFQGKNGSISEVVYFGK